MCSLQYFAACSSLYATLPSAAGYSAAHTAASHCGRPDAELKPRALKAVCWLPSTSVSCILLSRGELTRQPSSPSSAMRTSHAVLCGPYSCAVVRLLLVLQRRQPPTDLWR